MFALLTEDKQQGFFSFLLAIYKLNYGGWETKEKTELYSLDVSASLIELLTGVC